MSIAVDHPTSYPEVNKLLKELLESVQAILGSHFIGMYLDGSLTSGDFDQDSDVDFVVVTDMDVSGSLFSALQTMHDRIALIDSAYAVELEGSYISQQALRRYDPAHVLHPNIERGRGGRLKMAQHDDAWAVHRHVLRERGITLVGPAPQTLIDPVAPNDLQQAMLKGLHGWAAQILDDPGQMKRRGYQSYTVLTLCRILYTLENGSVASKSVAARWAQETLGERWVPLIERTWEGRHNPELEAPADDVNGTLEFIRFSLERGRQLAVSMTAKENFMISRVWHGWTMPVNADAYEALLKEEIFIGIRNRHIAGYKGIQLFRRSLGTEVEFVTVMWFDSLEAVRAFAGEDYEVAVVPPKARALLSRFDARSQHYEVKAEMRV